MVMELPLEDQCLVAIVLLLVVQLPVAIMPLQEDLLPVAIVLHLEDLLQVAIVPLQVDLLQVAIVPLQVDLLQVAIVPLQAALHQVDTALHPLLTVIVLRPLSQVMGAHHSLAMEVVNLSHNLRENFQPHLKYSMGDLVQ